MLPNASTTKGLYTQKLVHFTYVFNIFVFMQIFNFINARKLGDPDYNVFAGFFTNWLFSAIVVITVVIQMLMIEIGGKFVKVYPLGLDANLFCIALGSTELVWGVIIKLAPARYFGCLSLDDKPSDTGK